MHTAWAFGVAEGLSPRQIAERDADFTVLEARWAVCLAVGAVATLLLVLRRPVGLRTRTAVALARTGSGAAGCRGAHLSLVALMPDAGPGKRFTGLARLTYAGEMIIGLLLAACLAAVLRWRSAEA
ncbi:hypothetical protein GTW71_36870 [Streptomyces sp. SID6041]|nr:hypothetical protein [Streptomyces sp. SID6041]